jgi:hypothetical protein
LVVAAAGVYCWFTAGTKPFTLRADVLVAVPLVISAALAAVFAWRKRRLAPRQRRAATAGARSLWPWWLAVGLLGAWELFCYAQAPRHEHPTVSSIYDAAAGSHVAKAIILALWLLLGWVIVRAFSPRPA